MGSLNRKYRMFLILTALSSELLASTSDWRNNRLLSLEKVTVGPSDNYQSSLQSEKNILYFTRNENRISQLYMQDLKTGKSKRLLNPNTDAKDPAISPDNRWLAMTNFHNDAQGDISLYPLDKEDKVISLSDYTAREHSPFWINSRELGYIKQSMMSGLSQLIIIDIYTKIKKVLMSGNITAPSASPNGQYIVFHQHKKEKIKSGIYIYDLKNSLQFGPFPIALPGLSSYSRFSDDSKYLYFAHYLNDTSADQNIDGKDHSIVFRVEVAKLLKADKPILPEQLTSVEQNCNFPMPTSKYLYLTCAYEGSLDIYRMPLSGRVPLQWSKEQIIEAHQSSKSYEDRLLLLNALQFRFHSQDDNSTQQIALLERQLSNHLEIGELSAAYFFVKKIEVLYKDNGKESLEGFYHNLAIILKLNSKALKQPQGMIRRSFTLELEQKRKQLVTKYRASGGAIFNAWIDTLLKKEDSALKQLNEVWQYKKELIPIAYYLAVELSRKLLKERPKLLLAQLLDASHNSFIQSESRLYYTFEYLHQLAIVEPDLLKRASLITSEIQNRDNQKNMDLFINELALINLIIEKDKSKKHQIFSKLMKSLKKISDPLMSRATHIRAILLLKSAGEYKFMELLSRHWLTISDNKRVGFYDIAQQYSIITINKAYGILNNGNINGATNTFYSAIRQTNDLEALYTFVVLGLTSDDNRLRERIKKSFEILKRDNLLKANSDFVKALQLLIADPKESEETLNKVTSLLEGLRPVGLTPALKNLLLGYIYHRKLLMNQENYKYDTELYQKAHYQYMLALDQAYDNQRLKASVLQNLGQLHFRVGNYSMATDFFAKRTSIPFLNKQNEALFRWHFARSLFYYNNYIDAAKEGEIALKLAQESEMKDSLIAFTQQTAFYNMYATHYQRAITLYKKVLKDESLKEINRAKALLGYGYSLLKLQQPTDATKVFQELITLTSKLKTVPADIQHRVNFEPQRLQLLAYGFLASSSNNSKEKIDYLSQRINILTDIDDRIKDFAYDEKSRLEFLIKALQQKAVVYEQSKLLQQMQITMSEALKLLPIYLAQGGGYNSQVVIRTLNNYLSLALLYPQQFKNREPIELESLVNATIKALTLKGYTPPITSMERFKLQLLKTTYDVEVICKKTKQQLQELISNLREDSEWLRLKNKKIDLLEEVEELIL